MNGNPFYEPTLRLDFLKRGSNNLAIDQFAIVRIPTSVAGGFRWTIFLTDPEEPRKRILCVSIEKGSDGLFDAEGSTRWTCNNEAHPPQYQTAKGRCQILVDNQYLCGRALIPMIPNSEPQKPTLRFDSPPIDVRAPRPYLDLGEDFGADFDWHNKTIECWVMPVLPASTRPDDSDSDDDFVIEDPTAGLYDTTENPTDSSPDDSAVYMSLFSPSVSLS
jgi:hypothetical protein